MKHSSTTPQNNNENLFRFRGTPPRDVFDRMPELRGRRIDVSFKPGLTAWRGQLLSRSMKGDAVYAGCFLRKREIILEEQMLRTPRVLERIFVHEVFHFVWSKLSVSVREAYEELVLSELRRGARGELGWSAESMKMKLTEEDKLNRTRRWKDYLCESFCDTAGWMFGARRHYSERTLAGTFRQRRRQWVRANLLNQPLSI